MFQRISYIFAALLAVNALIWLTTAVKFIGYPYSIDFGEGFILAQSSMLIHGQNIYPPINDYPYMVSNYHPLYPLIAGLPFLFTNPGLWSGRLITLLSAIGCMVIIGRIVFNSSKRIDLAVIASLIPICLSYPYNWTFVFRVDFLGIFLSMLGLYFYLFPPKKGGIYISIIAFALAFMTKLTFVLAPLACLIDLYTKKDKRSNLFLLYVILGLGIPYLLINLFTGFGMFKHTFQYTANAFHLGRMIEGYREIFEYTYLLWAATLIGLALSKYKHKALLLSYLGLVLLSMITYGAQGSDSNYFIEIIMILSISSLVGLKNIIDLKPNESLKVKWEWIVLVLIIVFCFSGRILHYKEFGKVKKLAEYTTNGARIDSFVRGCAGEVVSEDATFLARNNKEMLFQPYIMSLLYRKGKWDQSQFVEDLESARFEMLILRFHIDDPYHTDRAEFEYAGFDRFTDEMEQAIKKSYTVYSPIQVGNNVWYIYKPALNLDADE